MTGFPGILPLSIRHLHLHNTVGLGRRDFGAAPVKGQSTAIRAQGIVAHKILVGIKFFLNMRLHAVQPGIVEPAEGMSRGS